MKTLVKHIFIMIVVLLSSSVEAQNVYSYYDGQAVHLRWKGKQDAGLSGYRISRVQGNATALLGETKRVSNNKDLSKILGAQKDLFLKLVGAESVNSDFSEDLYQKLVANNEAYQFLGALGVLNVNFAKVMGEYYNYQISPQDDAVQIRIEAKVNGDFQVVGETSVNIKTKGGIEKPVLGNHIVGQNTVDFLWDISVDPLLVGTRIYRSESMLGPYTLLNPTGSIFTSFNSGVSSHQYVDNYLAPNTYYYYLTNINLFGFESERTEIVEVEVNGEQQLEPITGFKVIERAGNVSLTWDTPDSNVQFRIYRGVTSAEFEKLHPVSDRMQFKSNHFTDRTAIEGQRYFYYIQAYTSSQPKGQTSDTVLFSLVDKTPPTPPIEVKGTVAKNGVVNITWKANEEADILGYEVERYTGDSGINNYLLTAKPLTTTKFSESLGPKSQSAYRYVIYAIDQSYNRSKPSQPIRLRRPDDIPPAIPDFKYSKVTDSIVTLRWTQNFEDDFKLYVIYELKGTTKEKFLEQKENEAAIIMAGPGLHHYVVSAVDFDGNESQLSSPIDIKYSPEYQLNQPANGQALDSANSIFLTWLPSSSSSTIGYLIERQEIGSDVVQLIKDFKSTETAYFDRRVDNTKEYTYFITAYDKDWFQSKPLEIIFQPGN